MDPPDNSPLYSAALAAAKFADQRLEPRTRTDYNSSLRRFAEFCQIQGYPNPFKERFFQLPGVIAAYINQLATTNKSQWPAEKLRAAISWHYTKPEMLADGHPHDHWVVDIASDGTRIPRGNPARSAAITHILTGISKAKKRVRTPKRASPMSLSMLSRMMSFLEADSMFNETMRTWFSAVCSLAFYGMCRINEGLLMKKGDIQFGLRRRSRKSNASIKFDCFTIRDRKTDHDPLASRTYSLHYLPKKEHAAEALTYVERWFTYAATRLHHKWRDDDYAFPSLTKIPRSTGKRRTCSKNVDSSEGPVTKVGIKWGSPMSDTNFTQVLNIVAGACGICKSVLGDDIWFTPHCFRRGGAQHRFMLAPEKRRWSLKLVKWWAGWSPSEKAETVTRYLLDDVLDREENQLGDSLAPDAVSCSDNALTGFQDISYDSFNAGAEARTVSRNEEITMQSSVLDDLKSSLLEGIRDMVKEIAASQTASLDGQPSECSETAAGEEDNTHLMSELPDAKSWRDYIDQYWNANPSLHQYRAGVAMLPHERKRHRSRLSRMKLIAEFVRDNYNDDKDRFETAFSRQINGELTVNKILCAIRMLQRSSVDDIVML